MSTGYPPIPQLHRQPPAVDFIDHRLPKHHPAFRNHTYHYDPMTEQLVPNGGSYGFGSIPTITVDGPEHGSNNDLPSRPMYEDTKGMHLWKAIFPKAMVKFTEETEPPKDRVGSRFDIRCKHDWESVFETLAAAKEQYKNGGRSEWREKVHRQIRHDPTPVGQIVHMAAAVTPSDPYTTPILGALTLIVEIWQNVVDVRTMALDAFEDLLSLFSRIEESLQMHGNDGNINKASVNLMVSVLNGVECGISFFVDSKLRKLGRAIARGDKYGQPLSDSLAQIKDKSEELFRQLQMSSMRESHESHKRQREHDHWMMNITVTAVNSVFNFLNEHSYRTYQADERLAHLEESLRPDMTDRREFLSQDALRYILNAGDFEQVDIATVSKDSKWRFDQKELAQAESLIHTTTFRNWIVSTTSDKLLAYWGGRPPRGSAGLSPLSAVCCTMARALSLHERFISLAWFGGCHVNRVELGQNVGAFAMVSSLIDQLLRQHTFDMKSLPYRADSRISYQDRLWILSSLIRQLPRTRTICCIIDGAGLLERPQYWDEVQPVLDELFSLANDPSVSVVMKMLLASASYPRDTRRYFMNQGLTLDVATIPRSAFTSSDARMTRELGQAITNDGRVR